MPRLLRRRNLLIVGLVAAVILGAYFGGLLGLAPIDYSQDTRILHSYGPDGGGAALFFAGYWNDGSVKPQFADAPSYITSWKTAGAPEAVFPTAQVAMSIGVMKYPSEGTWKTGGVYKYYYSTGGSWVLMKETPVGGPTGIGVTATTAPPNPLYYLNDLPKADFNGWLRVEYWTSFWSPGINIIDGDAVNDQRTPYQAWVRDDAELRSGRGAITKPTELQVFGIGQTIDITVDLGASKSAKVGAGTLSSQNGYTLELFSDAQGKNVKTWDLPDGPGTFSVDRAGNRLTYTVTQADFSTATGCKNTLTLKLFNDYFLKDQSDVKTINLNVPKPPSPLLAVSSPGGTWEEGETVRIEVTNLEPGATVNMVIEHRETGARLVPTKVSEGVYEFTPTVSGTYDITTSQEADCGASDPVTRSVVIKEGEPPDCDACQADGEFPLLAVILLLVGILFVSGGILLPVFDIRIKLVMMAMGGVLIVISVLSLTGAL